MGVAIDLSRVADLSVDDRDALRALSIAVYPPGASTTWAGRALHRQLSVASARGPDIPALRRWPRHRGFTRRP